MAACGPAHIAVMAVPLHGHVHPYLGLIPELTARGHQVSFAIPAEFADRVTDAGATARCYDSLFPRIGDPERARLATDTDGSRTLRLFRDEAAAVLPEIDAMYADDRPDMLIYDSTAYHAPMLARRWSVPAVQMSPTHIVPDELTPGDTESQSRLNPDYRPCLVAIPRALQFRARSISAHNTFVGPMLPAQRASDGRWERADGRPVLLVSLGSVYTKQAELLWTCIKAFGEIDWHVVLAVGEFFDRGSLTSLPSNIEVHPWVPQLAVLAEASVFVTHAGMGSTMEALASGVPLVAIPQAGDQFVTAMRIAELGLGKVLRNDQVTAGRLRAAVLDVARDTGIAEQIDWMRGEIADSGGACHAADIIESYLPSS